MKINVAILTNFYFFCWDFQDFIKILDGYSWKDYSINVEKLDWYDVVKDNLKGIDVVIIPVADTFFLYLKSLFSPLEGYRWKKNLNHFIKEGGGVVAHCGGLLFFCRFHNNPKTFSEKLSNSKRSKIFVSGTKVLWNISIPPIDQIFGGNPGESAYVYYSGMNTNLSKEQATAGIPLRVRINRKHPIFMGVKEKSYLVRWIGGPALIPAKESDVLAFFPDEEVFERYRIHKWRFKCWNKYIKKSLKESLAFFKMKKNLRDLPLYLLQLSWKMKCWEKTAEFISLNVPNRPAMVAETYGKGRIVLCSFHPEKSVWNPSKAKLVEEKGRRDLWSPVVYWENIEDKISTDWIVRREIAWASGKVPLKDMPPVEEGI